MFQSVRQIALCSFVGLLCLPLFAAGAASAYPDQPIKIIVTFPPGGSADIVIRTLQPAIAEELHETIVIENRSGAILVLEPWPRPPRMDTRSASPRPACSPSTRISIVPRCLSIP
jgi:hypothetical protein